MTRQELFDHIAKNWYLQDNIIYSYLTHKPVAFSCIDRGGHPFQKIQLNGRHCSVYIQQAIFMLHHNRPIGEGMQIHHIDGNPLNNDPSNLIELTRKQHRRIHYYQSDDPLRGIYLRDGTWCYVWQDDNDKQRQKRFHEINEAMKFRAMIEEPRRAELRALGLDC